MWIYDFNYVCAIVHTFAKMCGAFDVNIVFCESNFLVANKLASYLILRRARRLAANTFAIMHDVLQINSITRFDRSQRKMCNSSSLSQCEERYTKWG